MYTQETTDLGMMQSQLPGKQRQEDLKLETSQSYRVKANLGNLVRCCLKIIIIFYFRKELGVWLSGRLIA